MMFWTILGYIAIVFGVYAIFHEDIEAVVGIIGLVIGIGLKVPASFISPKKSEREAGKNRICEKNGAFLLRFLCVAF
jgi:hypothetical protein